MNEHSRVNALEQELTCLRWRNTQLAQQVEDYERQIRQGHLVSADPTARPKHLPPGTG